LFVWCTSVWVGWMRVVKSNLKVESILARAMGPG
jgi:hypothetical protein